MEKQRIFGIISHKTRALKMQIFLKLWIMIHISSPLLFLKASQLYLEISQLIRPGTFEVSICHMT
jgi:hypothetical protein